MDTDITGLLDMIDYVTGEMKHLKGMTPTFCDTENECIMHVMSTLEDIENSIKNLNTTML